MSLIQSEAKTYSCEKNRQIAEQGKTTKQRRSLLQAQTIELGVNKKYAEPHEEKLEQLFLQAKWLTNDLIHHLEDGKISSWDDKKNRVQVRMGKDSNLYEDRDITILSSKNKQNLRDRYKDNLSSLHVLKENGHKVGKLQYVKTVDSIPYNQLGNDFDVNLETRMIRIQKIGWLKVHGLSQLPQDAEIATGVLLNTPRGYVFHLTYYIPKKEYSYTPGTIIGIDFGVKRFLTMSDGTEYTNNVPLTPRLKNLQRKLSRQQKGSNNYIKTLCSIQKCYHDISHQKDDIANKLVNFLLKTYEIIVIQDESLKAWKRLWGKKLHHAILGRVKKKLKNHPRVIILSKWVPTTQYCPDCEKLNKHSLDKRVYSCACGYTEDRDIHAARNMVRLAVLHPELRETNQDLDLSWVKSTHSEWFYTPSTGRAGV